uniref:Uncharacterized protein n=1 Tax=uncultured Nocardioidaceae bacterium TaxID=253824 RepID=A0A6J4L2G5_9ACTN|nr:MAG: hypothetical protein AVDCRST_MAG46-851 [uncultured Nocardioidaceae bacterium]
MKTFTSRLAAAAAICPLLVGGGLVASGAQAQGQGSDHTRVVLKPSVTETLEDAGVEATAINGAYAYLFKGTIAIHFNETSQRNGVLKHNGGVVLKSDSGRVSLRRLVVNLNKDRVTALVNGDQRARVLTVSTPSRRPQLGRLRLKLTGVAAGVLNDAFGTRFERKDTLAYATAFGRD